MKFMMKCTGSALSSTSTYSDTITSMTLTFNNNYNQLGKTMALTYNAYTTYITSEATGSYGNIGGGGGLNYNNSTSTRSAYGSNNIKDNNLQGASFTFIYIGSEVNMPAYTSEKKTTSSFKNISFSKQAQNTRSTYSKTGRIVARDKYNTRSTYYATSYGSFTKSTVIKYSGSSTGTVKLYRSIVQGYTSNEYAEYTSTRTAYSSKVSYVYEWPS